MSPLNKVTLQRIGYILRYAIPAVSFQSKRLRRCTAVNKLHSPTRVVPSRSSTNFLPFLSGSGREATAAKIPLDGILLGSSRNSQHGKRLHQNQYNKKQGAKIPLLKVLEILKNFFQEVFKQGLGQSPKVLGLGQSPKVLGLNSKKSRKPTCKKR